MRSRLLVPLLASLALAGCAHYFVNERAERFEPQQGYRFERLERGDENTDSLLVCLSFSGGGTRAAALSYGVLERLRDTEITWEGKKKRLLDEVDVISAVSGGSFTAAYYGLRRERVFPELREKMLACDLQALLEWKVLRNSWWLWADHHYKRSDLAAELWDDRLFEHATFADFRARPFVILNATDMTTGQRFEFTQDQFDLLGSSVDSYPVARAVAASSAVPFLLSTITLRNHTRLEGPSAGFALPGALTTPLEHADDDPRLCEWARSQRRYVVGPEAPSYLHLTDGGVADNTGVRALWTALRREDGFLRRAVQSGRVKKLVVIQVNAQMDPLQGLGDTESAPGIASVTAKATAIVIDNSTFENLLLIRDDPAIKELLEKNKVELHLVDVGFHSIQDDARRERLLAIPTRFELSQGDLDAILGASKDILAASPAWRRLLASLR